MFKRLLLYFAVSTLLVLVITSLNKSIRAKKETVKEAVEGAPQLISQILSASDGKDEGSKTEMTFPLKNSASQEADPQFVVWFQQESQIVESTNVEQKQKEEEVAQKMKSVRSPEVDFLKQKSLDMSIAQKERLLSTYMLTMGGAATKQALIDIASQPLQTASPAQPHSLDELKLNSEKSLKIMSMDAIFEGTDGPEQKIRDLEIIKSKLSDPSLIIYAQRKIDELKTQL